MSQLGPLKLLFWALLLLLSGCLGSGNYAPVMEGTSRSSHHTVSRGETLFSIAWRYGYDHHQLAAANGISAPYTIYPGQKLLLSSKPKVTTRKTTASATRPSRPSSKPSTTSVKKTPKPAPVAKMPTSPKVNVNVSRSGWRWPTQGRLTQRFSAGPKIHKGIDLVGKLGQPVYAANAGKVVYAGSGLVGYGLLIIVKHNDQYLSAYAHNHAIHVKEGAWVKAGQRIAEMGDSGTDRVKLHFEIRRNGKPIDPLKLLPKQ